MEKIVKDYKKEAVSQIKTQLEASKSYVFVDYRGVNVKQSSDLRKKLRQNDTQFHVMKNNYVKIALRDLGVDFDESILKGPTALALIHADAGLALKDLFAVDDEVPLEVKGAIIEGVIYDAEGAEAYSKLPSKSELIAKLLGTLNAPVQHLAYAVRAVPQGLVYALNAIKEKE